MEVDTDGDQLYEMHSIEEST